MASFIRICNGNLAETKYQKETNFVVHRLRGLQEIVYNKKIT